MNINIGSLGFILTLIIQTAGLAYWLGRLGARVDKLEKDNNLTEGYRTQLCQKIDQVSERLIRVEMSLEYTKKKVEQIEKVLEKK